MFAHLDLEGLMVQALDEARAAGDDGDDGDVPVGALLVRTADGVVVARGRNERERRSDPTAHAEMLALRDAAAAVGSWRLDGHLMIVTLEPCPMCAGAALAARLDGVVFGAADPKAGACGSLYNFAADPRLNHEMAIVSGVRAGDAASLLEAFFSARRS
jgi:tRNA(adenine34) deaminase